MLFVSVLICGNLGHNGGAISNNFSTVVLTNVLMTGNVASNAGGAVDNYNSDFTLTNGTISGNYNSPGISGIYNEWAENVVIRNSIISGNYDTDIFNYNNPTSLDISFSMYGELAGTLSNTTFESNIGSTDPQFVNAPSSTTTPFTGGDYHLQSASPLINVGYNAYFQAGGNPDLSDVTTDLDGNLRNNGSRIDLGAYESLYALPVEFINFTAEAGGTKAKLKWSTGSEINNKEFIISRSADGKNFTETGKVAGSGNTRLQNDYVFYDGDPFNGLNYYRLEQVDYDGRITTAGIRTVNFSSLQNAIAIYPNPVRDFLKVTFGAGHFQRIELTDVNGKVLQIVQLSNRDTEKKMDIANLSSGVYFLRLAGNGNIETRKVIK